MPQSVSSQNQQFKAAVTGDPKDLGVTWSVDGISGGNAAVEQITAAGLYTPPPTAGSHTILASSVADTTKTDSAIVGVSDLSGVFTYHNNLARDGTNLQEYALTPANVNTTTFGKLFSCPLDGVSYTQPLWIPSFSIGGTKHNLLVVATEHDSAYGFDADASPCTQLWHVNLLDASHGGTSGEIPVPAADVEPFLVIQPEIGVTGTPVIDATSNTIYLVSFSEGPTGTFRHRLHALDLATGNEKDGAPIKVSLSVPGSGYDSSSGNITFNPEMELQRSALALVNKVVYVAWASYGDKDPYHGWVIGYDSSSLAPVAVFNTSPNGERGGIWMSGGAPAADSNGDLYLNTGNGTFDGNSAGVPNNDFGDSVLRRELRVKVSSGTKVASIDSRAT